MILYLYKYGELDMVISGNRQDVDAWKDKYDRILLVTSEDEEEFIFPQEEEESFPVLIPIPTPVKAAAVA